MSTLFDAHVARALAGSRDVQRDLLPAVEKEILHHDIFRELHEAGLLAGLTFFGGTNLRLCHGSQRLSEDLDFKGGRAFNPGGMERLASVIVRGLGRKYGLSVSVEGPKPMAGNTSTWTIRMVTRPGSKTERQQKINIDICSLEAYERSPRLLANHYAVDMGTTGLITNSQGLKESYTDKLIAVAFRKRLQSRDLWDLAWLRPHLPDASPFHLDEKILEHGRTPAEFLSRLDAAVGRLKVNPEARVTFMAELSRFLPGRLCETASNPDFWIYSVQSLAEDFERCERTLSNARKTPRWEL